VAKSIVERCRLRAGLTRLELATLAGVSPSTVGRIESGLMNPTVEMVDRLLSAAGARQTVVVEQLSDPTAIAAARYLLGEKYLAGSAESGGWLERFAQLSWVNAEGPMIPAGELARRASQFAKLGRRPGIRYYALETTLPALVESLANCGTRWSMTGISAINQLGVTGDEVWPCFYVEDITVAQRAMNLTDFRAPGRQVSLIPFDGMSEVGSYEDATGIWWADSLQVLMDCFGGAHRMPQTAQELADRWDRDFALAGTG
jgi:transcriptional regulator with XRE-family HTH domain